MFSFSANHGSYTSPPTIPRVQLQPYRTLKQPVFAVSVFPRVNRMLPYLTLPYLHTLLYLTQYHTKKKRRTSTISRSLRLKVPSRDLTSYLPIKSRHHTQRLHSAFPLSPPHTTSENMEGSERSGNSGNSARSVSSFGMTSHGIIKILPH